MVDGLGSLPMKRAREIRQELLKLLEEIDQAVRANSHTNEAMTIALHDKYAMETYWRCLGLFEGARHLLARGLAQEAGILGRSLFTDSLRLMELDAAGDARGGFCLAQETMSLREMEGLAREAHRLGYDD